jgi:hypothetical protein
MSDPQPTAGGLLQRFQNANLFCATTIIDGFPVRAGDVHEVHGAILAKYEHLAGTGGILGFPTTDQTATRDGNGQFNHFQHGSIYWHPSVGAFEVHGPIRDKWAALGWESFGYPTTDQDPTPDGIGRRNHFRNFLPTVPVDASIYWHPDTGAHGLWGPIRDAWAGMGWEASFLGYPTADLFVLRAHHAVLGEHTVFQNGTISWTPGSGAQVAPQAFVVNAPSITFGGGTPIGGSGRLTLYSDGTTHFEGHLHDSGFPSFDCLVVFAVKCSDRQVFAAPHTGRTHGSDEPGSRDTVWDDWGHSDDVQRNWPNIRSGGVGNFRVDVTSDWSPQKIAEDVAAVLGLILAIIPLVFSGGHSSKKADPNYRLPDASEGFVPGPGPGPSPLPTT